MILVSPAEPERLKVGFEVSGITERYGVDFMFAHDGGLYGVQRKEVGDFLASVGDGRLSKELVQMGGLSQGVLLVEGELRWSEDGVLMNGAGFGRQWTRGAWLGYLWSVRARGVWVDGVRGWQETVGYVRAWEKWVRKGDHTATWTRAGVVGAWGEPTNVEYVEWLLQGLPGVGVKRARDIVEKLGTRVLRLGVGRDELMGVEGVGKKTVDAIMRVFESDITDRSTTQTNQGA